MRLAIGAARMFFWDWNIVTGAVEWSEGLEAACGLAPGSFGGTVDAFRALIHPDDLPGLAAAATAAERAGAAVDAAVRQHHRDGSVRWVHCRSRPEAGADGRVYWGGVVTNVTARVEAERRLADSEARFRAFMDHNPAVGWMKDEAGRFVYLSPYFQRLFGVEGDWLGKTDWDMWPDDLARQFVENDRRVRDGGAAVHTVEKVRDPAGAETRWQVIKFPFADAAGGRCVGGTAVDITDRERLAAELRARNADLERANADLRAAAARVRELEAGIVTMCAWTRTVKMDGRWVPVEEFLQNRLGVRVSHGISEEALERVKAEMAAGATA